MGFHVPQQFIHSIITPLTYEWGEKHGLESIVKQEVYKRAFVQPVTKNPIFTDFLNNSIFKS